MPQSAIRMAAWGALLYLATTVRAEEQIFDFAPIHYATAALSDPISDLQKRMAQGNAEITFDDSSGYLPSLLKALNISPSSQILVFSRTSFQIKYIGPKTPRAIYFGDGIYVAWVQNGPMVEIASIDPRQGAVFYTLEQSRDKLPQFVRNDADCLQCHTSTQTQGVPGTMVRSMFTDDEGFPVLTAKQFTTNHRSPIAERWGGWYVSARQAEQAHMGNRVIDDPDEPGSFDTGQGKSALSLDAYFDTSRYLTPHSDIVALLVLEHQTHMHNLITRAGYRARIALHRQQEINQAAGRPDGELSSRTLKQIHRAGDALLRYMLFVDEAKLQGPIVGIDPGFVTAFGHPARRDEQGRSLRDLDLKTRLFKYPCSYLIHSPAFAELPDAVRNYVMDRLSAVVADRDADRDFAHLSVEDRKAIRAILITTLDAPLKRRINLTDPRDRSAAAR